MFISGLSSYLPLADEQKQLTRNSLNWKELVPNADYHFAAGDITKWSGIKRCGAAMHQGHYAAMNIHKRIVEQRTGQCPKFNEMGEVPPMIGLAVGKKAVAYSPGTGTSYGEDVAHAYFRDDLGWGSKFKRPRRCLVIMQLIDTTVCWNWMGLGGRNAEAKA